MNRKLGRETWAVLLLLALTAAIYLGSAGIPALLDDTDSFYAEVAREMSLRHNWITPYANSIRYLEKSPLFYWLMAASYSLFGSVNTFTARLPTALAATALVFVTYRIGRLLFGFCAGLFGGLALATSIGLFLFTRIIMPDALFTLLFALTLYAYLRWERAERKAGPLLSMYALAGLAVLAKGLIGIVFPALIVAAALALDRKPKEITQLISLKGIGLFLLIAAPWHLLVGVRNPGFFWFYFINEHLLRFLGKRYPMDYGTVPLTPFWLLHLVWLFPWSVYLLTLCWPQFSARDGRARPRTAFPARLGVDDSALLFILFKAGVLHAAGGASAGIVSRIAMRLVLGAKATAARHFARCSRSAVRAGADRDGGVCFSDQD